MFDRQPSADLGPETRETRCAINNRLATVLLALCLQSLAASSGAAAPQIVVEALFPDAAVLQIDGQRKMLRAGHSFGGVTLVSADSGTATVEIDGRRQVLQLSRHVGTVYQAPEKQVVTVRRNSALQYQTTAQINGRNVPVLVDTGANVVALNAAQARALGVDYDAGQPAQVETASGRVKAWAVTLRSVSVGGIRVENVRASVVDGEFPATILLGMTYLQHVEMEENNGVLSLSRAW
jgi:aspartyl protease family protein